MIMRMRHLLLVALVATMASSCQMPFEPDLTVAGVEITVRVEDQGGNGVPGLKILYRREQLGDRQLFGITDGKGNTATRLQVPIAGSPFWFDVAVVTAAGTDSIIVADRRFTIGCRDSLYVIGIVRRETVACNQSGPIDDEALAATLCTGSKVLCSRIFSFACDFPVHVTISPGDLGIAGAALFLRRNGTPLGAGVTATDLANAGDGCEVCMNYSAQPGSGSHSGVVAVDAQPAGKPNAQLFQITFTATTSCDSCSCPALRAVRYPAAGADTLCSDSTADAVIDLSGIINTNSTCNLLVRIVRGPQDAQVRVLDFNDGSSTLLPGEKLGPLRLRVTPARAGAIDDSVRIAFATVSQSGNVSPCDSMWIPYHFVVLPPPCPPIFSGNLIASQPPITTNQISASVCADAKKTLTIRNPSTRCPLRIIDAMISGLDAALFTISPSGFPTEVPANDSLSFDVAFAPTRSAYLNSGTPPRSVYNATLSIQTVCGTTTMPLSGRVNEPKMVPSRLFTFTCTSSDSSTGFVVLPDGSVNSNQGGSDPFVMTVESINAAAPRSAVLNISVPFGFVRGGFTSATPICDLRFDPAAAAACANPGAPGRQVVREGEVYVLSYQSFGCPFCALLWVEQIDDVSPVRSCPQVQFRICSPIVM